MNYSSEIFIVGGHIRDKILGLKSNDIDKVVIIDNNGHDDIDMTAVYYDFCTKLEEDNYSIFVKDIKNFTIRARSNSDGIMYDFTISAKIVNSKIVPCTLREDLMRRDFTVNAMAEDSTGSIIDVCDGIKDAADKILRCPGPIKDTILYDLSRTLRGPRLAMTKQLKLEDDFWKIYEDEEILNEFKKFNTERKRAELEKMFKYSTIETINFLSGVRSINEDFYKEILNNISLKIKIS